MPSLPIASTAGIIVQVDLTIRTSNECYSVAVNDTVSSDRLQCGCVDHIGHRAGRHTGDWLLDDVVRARCDGEADTTSAENCLSGSSTSRKADARHIHDHGRARVGGGRWSTGEVESQHEQIGLSSWECRSDTRARWCRRRTNGTEHRARRTCAVDFGEEVRWHATADETGHYGGVRESRGSLQRHLITVTGTSDRIDRHAIKDKTEAARCRQDGYGAGAAAAGGGSVIGGLQRDQVVRTLRIRISECSNRLCAITCECDGGCGPVPTTQLIGLHNRC